MTSVSEISIAILAGGFGTRLKEVLPNRQKTVANVAGRPFLVRLLERLSAQGCSNAVLCTGHLSEQVKESCGERIGSLLIEYSQEAAPLGTAGALRLASERMSHEITLVLNGDSYVEFELARFLAQFEASCVEGSLLLAEVPDTSRYGRVVTDERGRIVSFLEKGVAGQGQINAGAYLLRKNLLKEIPVGKKCSLEIDMFPTWASRGVLGSFRECRGFIDIGTPESFVKAGEIFRGD